MKLSADGISFAYGRSRSKASASGGATDAGKRRLDSTRTRPILDAVAADIVPGSFLAIIGVNGCGKSTFLNCLDGILAPQSGRILVDDRDLQSIGRTERAQAISYVTQDSQAGRTTVYDALMLGRKPFIDGAPTESDHEVVERVITRMGLEALALRYVDELSGGQRQKVSIARALVQCQSILLLDEPTNNLDLANQLEVMGFVRSVVDEDGIAAAAVMHDINLALAFCDRFLALKDGSAIAYGGSEIITEHLLEAVYGIEADIIEHAGRRIVIPRACKQPAPDKETE